MQRSTMTLDTSQATSEREGVRVSRRRTTWVIAVRGAVGGETASALRDSLLSAIQQGVKEVVLDISEAAAISGPAHELIAAASSTLADRGGSLLVWNSSSAVPGEDATFVMREVRGPVRDALLGVAGLEDGSSAGEPQ
jgi:anti-anti-sigma regulatory factor